MRISLKSWFIFALFSILSVILWFHFSYPQFSFAHLKINRRQALSIADHYLSSKKSINLSGYKKACIFTSDVVSDRYLQRALGFKKEMEFIKKHDYDLFFWLVRFFKENEKEEYRLAISASTGQVTTYKHIIIDTERRDLADEAQAKQLASAFLQETFGIKLENYVIHSQQSRKYENRTDHTFAWKENGVNVPWSPEQNSGNAKLLVGATVSGNEVLVFYKNTLEIPEKFNRWVERQKNVGVNLVTLLKIFNTILLAAAIFFVIARRNHLAMHASKNFLIALATVLFAFNIFDCINAAQGILYNYNTTSSLTSYLWRLSIESVLSSFIVTIAILMPGLSGESLHYEIFPNRKNGSFLHYINSTFFSRNIFALVALGYFIGIIMLGIQTLAFQIGYKYLGVWTERLQMIQVSTTYLPFLSAFFIGLRASFMEEITFRIFAISWIKKITKNIFLAVIFSSLIWGFGHSGYPIFPMWFRGLEVTCLGLFLSFIYLRYGIIPVLVAHYAFDVFWRGADFLLGKSTSFNFYTVFLVLLLPLIYGIVSTLMNKPDSEHKMRWKLSKHQIFNLQILRNCLANDKDFHNKTPQEIKEEFVSHGWDVAVIEEALKDQS